MTDEHRRDERIYRAILDILRERQRQEAGGTA